MVRSNDRPLWLLFSANSVSSANAFDPSGRYKPEWGSSSPFGYRPPGHFWRDVKLAWREVRMRVGKPRRNSSPERQQSLGLNHDVTLEPARGLGSRLRGAR